MMNEFNKIFVIGFPKCGTTSIHNSLINVGIKSCHWHIEIGPKCELTGLTNVSPVGCLIKKAKKEKKELLFYLNDYQAFTQLDANFLHSGNKLFSYYPQIEDTIFLDKSYPNSKFIFNYRNTSNWIRSLDNWLSGGVSYREVIKMSDIPGLPIGLGSDQDLINWYYWHKNNMIDYFKNKNNFILFNIESDNPQKLGDFLGFNNFTFFHSNKTIS